MTNSFFDTYAAYGLSENPFLIQALRPDERGRRLLVGRDEQIKLVAQRLHKHGKITCLDGQVGVGKTSLVNVSAYECFRAFVNGTTTQLLIPMDSAFQLTRDEDINRFCTSVFRRVAQTLLANREQVSDLFHQSGQFADRLGPWLNSPIVQHVNSALGGRAAVDIPHVASLGASGGVSTSSQVNQSAGFADQGFEQLVREWLDQIFSVSGNGGVVCVIDNLELLETGKGARRILEGLRDRLFTTNGLRWVFCGANGVIHSLASSPRLSSFLNTPVIDVAHVAPSAIEPLFRARLKEFANKDPDSIESSLPIRIEDLQRLYQIVNFNLRDLLACADEYCEHLHSINAVPASDDRKSKRFAKWLEKETDVRYQTLSSRLPTDAWAILDLAMSDDYRGTFGVGDYASFNRNSKIAIAQSTFEGRLRDMVKLGLLTKNIDDDAPGGDDGFKRDLFNVTAKGALVHYARLVRHETLSLKPLTWLKRVG